jgi:hypothetical protein
MADIKLNDLLTQNTSGSDLFSDSESFLKELSDEGEEICGGSKPGCLRPTCEDTLIGCWRGSVVQTIFAV